MRSPQELIKVELELEQAIEDAKAEHVEALLRTPVELWYEYDSDLAGIIDDIYCLTQELARVRACLSSYTKPRSVHVSSASQGSYGLDVSRETIEAVTYALA